MTHSGCQRFASIRKFLRSPVRGGTLHATRCKVPPRNNGRLAVPRRRLSGWRVPALLLIAMIATSAGAGCLPPARRLPPETRAPPATPISRADATPSSPSSPPQAEPVTSTEAGQRQVFGKIVAVSDGDTVTLLDGSNTQLRIRLAGVDAPEKTQDFGDRAKRNLAALVHGKSATVVTSGKVDRYERLVGKVLVDGRDMNLEQVRAGYAWHYKQFEGEQSEDDRELYSQAEVRAREAKLNIWSLPNPVPPWVHRKGEDAPAELRGRIVGNRKSLIYHWDGCPGFVKVAEHNRVLFDSRRDAEAAGFRPARNCTN